jgi:hypothetical protein
MQPITVTGVSASHEAADDAEPVSLESQHAETLIGGWISNA